MSRAHGINLGMYNVGIPAKNEEKSIESCIRSVFNQSVKPNKVIVCTNGCTDSTLEIVETLRNEFSNLIRIESQEGKGSAWNAIRQANSERLLLFVDADVIINKVAAEKLLEKIKGSSLVAIGGSSFRLKPETNFFTYLSDVSYEIIDQQRFLNGKLYLLDMLKVSEAENLLGIKAMPANIINEDQFLQKLSELSGGFSISREAYVTHHATASFAEWVGFRLRVSRGRKQLLKEYPLLFPKSDFFTERVGNYRHRFKLADSFPKKLGTLLFSLLKEGIGFYVFVFESEEKRGWNRVLSTKKAYSV